MFEATILIKRVEDKYYLVVNNVVVREVMDKDNFCFDVRKIIDGKYEVKLVDSCSNS